MADGARSLGGSRGGSPAASPSLGGRSRPPPPPGHGFRRVTLTKPTFCHCCTDFIWGLAGYQCEGKGLPRRLLLPSPPLPSGPGPASPRGSRQSRCPAPWSPLPSGWRRRDLRGAGQPVPAQLKPWLWGRFLCMLQRAL